MKRINEKLKVIKKEYRMKIKGKISYFRDVKTAYGVRIQKLKMKSCSMELGINKII